MRQMSESEALNGVFPVYILYRVFEAIREHARKDLPNEVLGVLVGYKLQYEGVPYVKIIDYATGEYEKSQVHAKFTLKGLQQYNLFLDERYGIHEHRPRVVGIYHSHPFNGEPFFSGVDLELFHSTLYYSDYNVFILLNPLVNAFKVYQFQPDKEKSVLKLQQVEAMLYSAQPFSLPVHLRQK